MVQEIITKSWFSRINEAAWGILIGLLLVIISFILILWNENQSLPTSPSLRETEQVFITVANTPIDANNNMRVVYFNGLATTNDTIQDPTFAISKNAIKLQRHVEMLQWQEDTETHTEQSVSGSEKQVITYTYKQIWSDKLIDSNEFKNQAGHQNPTKMAIEPKEVYAKNVTVGDFTLPSDLVKQMNGESPVNLAKVDLAPLQIKINKPMHHIGDDTIYVGTDPQAARIGDLKVTVSEIQPQTVSIIAQQTQHTLQPYMAPSGQPIAMLITGLKSPQQMLRTAESENALITWLLRLTSLSLMIFGISLLMRPLVALADVIPIIGSLMNFGASLIAFMTGLVIWAFVTAFAWFTIRPWLAIGLIAMVFVILYTLYIQRKKIIVKHS